MGFYVDPRGFNELEGMLLRQEAGAEKIGTAMLETGAAVLVGYHKAALSRVGASLASSVQAGKVRKSKNGVALAINVNTTGKLPHGIPRRGKSGAVTKAQAAFVAEYGSSKQPARPWRAAADRAAAPAVINAMANVWEAHQK
jgi:hypothetical protein